MEEIVTQIISVLSNIATILSIASAIVTFRSALKIESYYEKILSLYSVEKLTISEQKSIEAKKKYQELKKMYVETRGRERKAYSDAYMEIDNALDDIMHSIPVESTGIAALIQEAKNYLDAATAPNNIEKRSKEFLGLGTCLDNVYQALKTEKSDGQKENATNIKKAGG